MTESGLTTAREREEFKSIVRDFLTNNLANAPREHLHAIERAMNRWADEYDAQARQHGKNPLIACQLAAWAQAYRNAAALLVLTVQPRPKLDRRHGDDGR